MIRHYKSKICGRCGKEFIPTGSHQKYCPECRDVAYKEKKKQWDKLYRLAHLEQEKQRRKLYLQTPRGKEVDRKKQNKRKRNLGFVPYNEYFESSVAHHLDNEKVLYIPIELHKSIYHCLETGQGMKEINTLAVQCWISQVMKQGHKCPKEDLL